MKVTKQWLDSKITELNEWLTVNEKGTHLEYAHKKRSRDYYVNKFIELEEKKLETINV